MRILNYVIIVLSILALPIVAPSHASDAIAPFKQFEAYMKEQGGAFAYDSIEENGDGMVVVRNLNMSSKEGNFTLETENLSYRNIQQQENGWHFEVLEVADMRIVGRNDQAREFILLIPNFSANDVRLSNLQDDNMPFWPADIGSLKLTNLTVVGEGDSAEVEAELSEIFLSGLQNTGGNNFTLETLKVSPFTAVIRGSNSGDIGFGGLDIEDFEYFGLLGFDAGVFNMGAIQVSVKNPGNQKVDFVFGGMTSKNFYNPDPAVAGRPLISSKPAEFEVYKSNISVDGKSLAGWDSVSSSSRYDEESQSGSGDVKIENLYLNLGNVITDANRAQIAPAIEAFGSEKLSLNVNLASDMNLATGKLSVRDYRTELVDNAAIEIDLQLGGYTEELLRQLLKFSDDFSLETDPGKRQAKAMQVLSIFAPTTLDSMRISIEDQSLLNRVLALQAAQTNQDPEQVRQIAGPMTQLMLAPFNIPEFAASTAAAVSTFMEGNRSITATAAPPSGLSILEIIGIGTQVQSGQVQPAELIERLNLTIAAE